MNSSEEFNDDNAIAAEMKKIKRKVSIVLLTIVSFCILLFISLVGYGLYYTNFSMATLPMGDFVTESTSPDGTYTIKAYSFQGGDALRCELIFNKKNKRAKNIYWNVKEDSAAISWESNDRVTINKHSINVPNGKFDFRR